MELGFSFNGTDTRLSPKVCSDGERGDRHEWQGRTFWLALGKRSHGEGAQTPGWVWRGCGTPSLETAKACPDEAPDLLSGEVERRPPLTSPNLSYSPIL